MKLTVLGKYGPWPKVGCACSGYLLEAGEARILLDCGPGIVSRLQANCPLERLDAVILSHLHGDHAGDVAALRYSLPYFMGKGLRAGKLPVFLPATPADAAASILTDSNVDAHTVSGGSTAEIAGLRLEFSPVRHPVQCNAVKVMGDGKSFVYSGDMNTTDGFAYFARGADLLLIDGCFREADWNDSLPHLSAALAARVAKDAGVKRVLITHVRPVDDEQALLLEAQRVYPQAQIAVEGETYSI